MPIWTGAVSFGLVNIPASLETAQESSQKINFHLEDKNDHSPVGYKYYNKTTGKDIERKDVIKTYEFEKGKRVEVTPEELKEINKESSENIEIENFVPIEEIDLLLFERPYYLTPKKGAEKSYHLLRQAMVKTKMCGIGKIVIRQKTNLVLILPREEYIIVEILRYPHTIIEPHEADYLKTSAKEVKIPKRELDMAIKLVENMKAPWAPSSYEDNYYEEVMKLINKKIKGKKVHTSKTPSKAQESSNVADLMPLLRKSLEDKKIQRSTKSKKRA